MKALAARVCAIAVMINLAANASLIWEREANGWWPPFLGALIPTVLVNLLWYSSLLLWLNDRRHAQKRYLAIGFFIFLLRLWAGVVYEPVGELMSILVIYFVFLSQRHAVRIPLPLLQWVSRITWVVIVLLAFLRQLAGVHPDGPLFTVHAIFFTGIQLGLLGTLLFLYGYAAIHSESDIARWRFTFFLLGAGFYAIDYAVGFSTRLVEHATGGTPLTLMFLRRGLESVGLLCAYWALTMGPRLRGFLLSLQGKTAMAQMQRNILALVGLLSDVVAQYSHHILVTYCIALARRMNFSGDQLRRVHAAACIWACMNRYRLPELYQEEATGLEFNIYEEDPFLEMRNLAEQTGRILAAVGLEYNDRGAATPVEARVIKIIHDYLTIESEIPIREGMGTRYCPEATQAFLELLESGSLV